MIVSRENDDFEPLAWAGGFPLYATTLLVAAHGLALIGAWVAAALGRADLPGLLVFSSADVLNHGAIWEWATYFLAHLNAGPLFFLIEMYLLYTFGREVEKYIGRRKFIGLYATLVLVPALLLTLLGPVMPSKLEGSWNVHFAVFVAFVALYPGVEFFLRIPARWLAWGFTGLYGLFYASRHEWAGLCAFLSDAGAAWLFIAWLRGSISLPRLFYAWPRGGAGGKPAAPRKKNATPPEDPMASIDPLLDKIAREGLESLTTAEREKLEKARQQLMGKKKR